MASRIIDLINEGAGAIQQKYGNDPLDDQLIQYQFEVGKAGLTLMTEFRQRLGAGTITTGRIHQIKMDLRSLASDFSAFALNIVGTKRAFGGAADINNAVERDLNELDRALARIDEGGVLTSGVGGRIASFLPSDVGIGTLILGGGLLYVLMRKR